MPESLARVRFEEKSGQLGAVEVKRKSLKPLVSALHQALFAVGVVVSSYQVQATSEGLQERLELSSLDGNQLDAAQSRKARAAICPLVLGEG